ncbi:uncharacterized protein O3Q21_012505 [Podargus strigoides]
MAAGTYSPHVRPDLCPAPAAALGPERSRAPLDTAAPRLLIGCGPAGSGQWERGGGGARGPGRTIFVGFPGHEWVGVPVTGGQQRLVGLFPLLPGAAATAAEEPSPGNGGGAGAEWLRKDTPRDPPPPPNLSWAWRGRGDDVTRGRGHKQSGQQFRPSRCRCRSRLLAPHGSCSCKPPGSDGQSVTGREPRRTSNPPPCPHILTAGGGVPPIPPPPLHPLSLRDTRGPPPLLPTASFTPRRTKPTRDPPKMLGGGQRGGAVLNGHLHGETPGPERELGARLRRLGDAFQQTYEQQRAERGGVFWGPLYRFLSQWLGAGYRLQAAH